MNTFSILALLPKRPALPGPLPFNIGYAAALLVALLLGVVALFYAMRKMLHEGSRVQSGDWASPNPDTANASAFMAASMQGVIEKLRAQEKELARLHLLAQERAQEAERLTEEVRRNMPRGLRVVQGNSRRRCRSRADADRVPQRWADLSSQRSGAHDVRGRGAPIGRNDFADLSIEGLGQGR